jgi:hypothetical protein
LIVVIGILPISLKLFNVEVGSARPLPGSVEENDADDWESRVSYATNMPTRLI